MYIFFSLSNYINNCKSLIVFVPTQESNFVEFVILSNRVFILETEIADYAYINCNESDQAERHKNWCTDAVGAWNERTSETNVGVLSNQRVNLYIARLTRMMC